MTSQRSSILIFAITLVVLTGGAAYALGGVGRALLFMVPVMCGVLLLDRTLRSAHLPGTCCCGACGFDLRGAPESSQHCPECEADLHRHGAVRQRRRDGLVWPIAAGLTLVIVPLVLAGAVAAGRSVSGN